MPLIHEEPNGLNGLNPYMHVRIAEELNSALCDDLEGWDEGGGVVQEGGNICVHTADSLRRTAGANTPL